MTDEVERRLRSALTARAGQITPDRLRFGTPPTVAVPGRMFPFPFMSWLVVLSGAVITVVLGFTLRPGGTGGEPAPQPPPAVPSPVETESPTATPHASRLRSATPDGSPVATPRTTTPSVSPATAPGGTAAVPEATPTA